MRWDAPFHPKSDFGGGVAECASSHLMVVAHYLGTPVECTRPTVSTPPTAGHRAEQVLTIRLAFGQPRPLQLPPVALQGLPAALVAMATEWVAEPTVPP